MGLLQKLWRLIRGRRSGAPARSAAPGRPAQRPEDHVDLLRGHPGSRVTTVRMLGESADQTNVVFRRERIQTEDDQGNAREIDLFVAPVCSFGHLLDQNVHPLATCRICGALMCSTSLGNDPQASCAGRCVNCGAACCSRHRSTYRLGDGGTVTYCSGCRWKHWWRRFWGLYS